MSLYLPYSMIMVAIKMLSVYCPFTAPATDIRLIDPLVATPNQRHLLNFCAVRVKPPVEIVLVL